MTNYAIMRGMETKQKATKWLAHFALAVTLAMGTVTAGSAEAAVTKVVIKIIKKILKKGESTTQKGPPTSQKKKLAHKKSNGEGMGGKILRRGKDACEKTRCGDNEENDRRKKEAEESQENPETTPKGRAKDG